MKKKPLLIIDDHQVFLESLKLMLQAKDYEVDIAANAETAIALMMEKNYALVLLDNDLPDVKGSVILKIINSTRDAPSTLVLSGDDSAVTQQLMHEGGASGFVHKSAPPELLLKAISTVISGGNWWKNEWSTTKGENKTASNAIVAAQIGITNRQLQILHLVNKGLSNKQISHELNISLPTVKSHLSSLFTTLEVASRMECINKTRELGIQF